MLRRVGIATRNYQVMVPTAGVEPAQVAPLAPQTSASTNFATSADHGLRPTLHGLRPNFSRGSLREPRTLAALRAVKNKLYNDLLRIQPFTWQVWPAPAQVPESESESESEPEPPERVPNERPPPLAQRARARWPARWPAVSP